MTVIRSKMQIWELRASLVCSVGLFIANANVLPMKSSADFASTLITFSTVMLLHLLRIKKTAPVTRTWQICLDVLLYYFGNQITMALIWKKFCFALEDLSTDDEDFMPSRIGIVKTDFVFIIKTALALFITYKSMIWVSFLAYILPVRQPDPIKNPTVKRATVKKPPVKKPTRARKPSKSRSRSRSRKRRVR